MGNAVNNLATNWLDRLRIVERVAALAMPATTTLNNIPVATGTVNLNSQKISNLGGDTTRTSAARLADVWEKPRILQTGTSYTLQLTDAGQFVEVGNAGSLYTLTVPLDATTNFPVGTEVTIFNNSAFFTTLVEESGALTLRIPNDARTLRQYMCVTIIKRAANNWGYKGGSLYQLYKMNELKPPTATLDFNSQVVNNMGVPALKTDAARWQDGYAYRRTASSATTYTITSADAGFGLEFTSGSAVAVTIGADASNTIAPGTAIPIFQSGAGTVTITADVGVSVLPGTVTMRQNTSLTLWKATTDIWRVLNGLYTGVITSADILDGTIVNADINASAAIDGSKLQATSTTNSGAVELATTAEINTGTDSTRAMPVDQFVASNRNVRYMLIRVLGSTSDATAATSIGGNVECPITGTIVEIGAYDDTAGTTGTMTIDVNKNGTTLMSSTKISIETTEKSSRDATTQPVLTTTAIAAGDLITVDIDAAHTTPAKGLTVRLGIRLT